jgi:hypothetical protein
MLASMQYNMDAVRRKLLRPALVAITGLLIAGHLAGPAVTLFPMLAVEESTESESESSDETQETTPTTLADRSAFGVRLTDGPRRPASATVLLELKSARRNQAANLSPLGARDRLNGCGAILRC